MRRVVGLRQTPEYEVWMAMRQRCLNPKNKDYQSYGGRGIDICAEWEDFLVFYQDMGPRPLGYLLDRQDNNAGYSKGNCRWATATESVKNRRQATHCDNGHEFTPETTKLYADGRRSCIICWRAYHLARYHANKHRYRWNSTQRCRELIPVKAE